MEFIPIFAKTLFWLCCGAGWVFLLIRMVHSFDDDAPPDLKIDKYKNVFLFLFLTAFIVSFYIWKLSQIGVV